MKVYKLENYIGQLLEADRFRDYCPNGIQVEGRPEISLLVSGVSANIDLIKAAVDVGAGAILVHHGYFWKGEAARIAGVKRARIELLLRHNISLLAYHLPLDAHPLLGNNARLAELLDFKLEERFGDQNIACCGTLATPMTLARLTGRVGEKLQRKPFVVGAENAMLHRVAWCSGGAQGYFEEAVRMGVDAYLTGEISEQHVHLAREAGVAFIAAGHHATERYGVQALGDHLARELGIEHRYIDIDNPV